MSFLKPSIFSFIEHQPVLCLKFPGMTDSVGYGPLHGLAHFAISVGGKEAVNMLTERLRADGYTILSEPRTSGDGYYESAVADPEGNYVEILA